MGLAWKFGKHRTESEPRQRPVGRVSPGPKDKREWRLRSVVDHVTFSGSGNGSDDRMIAWHVLAPQQWTFRSRAEGTQLIEDKAQALAELVGSTVYGRVTHRPYPVSHWARAAYENAPDPQEGFAAMMDRDQVHMSHGAQWDKLVYFGVDLGSRGTALRVLSKLHRGVVDREMAALQQRLHKVAQVMAAPGMDADPATPAEMDWLLARSFALGCPVPVPDAAEELPPVLTSEDLAVFARSAHWSAEPLAPTVQITSSALGGEHVTRHVSVLSVARITDIDIPNEHEPWMSKADKLPFPVEWSFRVDVRTPEQVSKEMTGLSRRVDGQVDHWSLDHGKRPPKQLARQASRIQTVEDEMRSGFTGLATRTRGWYRIAVSGVTEQEALDRAEAVVELYRPQIRVVREIGQYAMAREFVPGEPLSVRAHARKYPVGKVAASLPAVSAEVGDKRGHHLGETTGMVSRSVVFDPWYLTERMEAGGFIPVVGTLGSGKSVLIFSTAYKSALSGVRGVIMDPAGRVRKMLRLPELAPISTNVDLLGSMPGSLSPYAVVPEPSRVLVRMDCEDPGDEAEFERRWQLAVNAAAATRRDLALSTLRWALPMNMDRDPAVQKLLRKAVTTCPADQRRSLNEIVSWLQNRAGGDGQDIAEELLTAADREMGRLFFHEPGSTRGYVFDTDARLTAFNLRGMPRPDPETEPEDWSAEERLSKPIIGLASWAALNLIYRGDPNERKFFGLDEAHEVTEGSGAGRALVTKITTDSRKNNTVAMVGTQNASKILGQAGINNFVGAAFVGRTRDESAQRDALALLGKPQGVGYEQILARLSPKPRDGRDLGYREFIYSDGLGGSDGQGGMEKIRVTLKHHPELFAALNTTADSKKAAREQEPVGPPEVVDEDAQDAAEFEVVS